MKREELIALRTAILKGDPPYEKDTMGNMRRAKGGTPGLEELRKLGDFGPGAASLRLSMGAQLALIDHLLERLR